MKRTKFSYYIIGIGLLFFCIFAFVLQNLIHACLSIFLSLLFVFLLQGLEEILRDTQSRPSASASLRSTLLDKSEHWYQQKLGKQNTKETVTLEPVEEETKSIEQKELLCMVCSTKNTTDREFCWMCGASLQKEE